MHGWGLERARLAGEQTVCLAGVGEQNAPRESKLATARVGAHFAAGGRDRNLQSPAAAEERHSGRKDGFGKFDLARHRRPAVVDIQGRTGHRDAIVVLEADTGRKLGRAVRGEHDVDAQGRVDAAQNLRVSASRVIAERRRLPRANLGDVAVDHQDPRAGHAALTTASSRPSTAARKMDSNCEALTGMGLPPADGSIAASRPMTAALSALTPISASEFGILSSRRKLSTDSRKPSKPRAGRSSIRAVTSILSAMALRLNTMTYGRMTALVSP